MESRTPLWRGRPVAWLALAAAATVAAALTVSATGADGASAAPRRSNQVVLPTGEHVEVVAVQGEPRIVLPAGASVPRARILRFGGHTYVVPIEAEASALDLSMFDIDQLARHQDRMPVSLRLTGTAVPGVTITARSGDTATGYVTPRSAPRLGAALRAGRGHVPGLRRMSLHVPAPAATASKAPRYTVDVTVKPPAGVTPDSNELVVVNVDDSRKFNKGYQFTGDEKSISVPAGHYVMVDEAVSAPATESDPYRDWLAFLSDFTVTGDGQTATIDTSAATASPYPSFTVPRPATEESMNIAYGVSDDRGRLAFNLGGWRQPGVRDYVAPVDGGSYGKLSTVAWAELTSPSSAASPYTYYLAQGHENAVVGDEQVPVSASDLATVRTHYYGDGRPMAGDEGRAPAYPYLNPGFVANGPTSGAPAVRTEYVYDSPGASWMTDASQGATDGSSIIEELTQQHVYQAGRSYREDYFRGPHAPGAFSEPGIGWPYCQACRTASTMQLGVATFTDSDPTHYGLAYGTADQADQHMTVSQDGTVIFDQDYATYGRAESFDIATGDHQYRVTGTYDGAADGQVLSPHATTEWDFRTTDADHAAPSEWLCLAHPSNPCDVLPMMAVSYALPTSPTGTMPPGTASFVVTVGHLQGAARTGITGLSFGVAADGSDSVPQQVEPLGGGRYRVTIDNPDADAGTGMTVTLHATDAAGGSISQTVQTAYTIAGS